MSDNVINATDNLSKRLDREILFNEIVSETIDKLKNQEATLSPDDLALDNAWEEICYQQQAEESFYWDMYMENLEFMIDVAIDDCAKKYKSSVSGIIEAIYGEYDEEETDYGEIETDVKEDVRDKILSLATDDECVRKQVDREYGDAATEDMYLSSIAMGMSEKEARERYYGNAEEDDVEES